MATKGGQPRFRSQQIVVTVIPPAFRDIVADSQQMARLVAQEAEFHLGQCAALQGEALRWPRSAPGVLAGLL
jgi:hypothetical protein